MTETLFLIAPWVLGSVCVGLCVGYFVGRSGNRPVVESESPDERAALLKVMVSVLEEMERVSGDVHDRKHEIQETARHMDDLQVTPEMEQMRFALLGHVTKLLESNQKLEDDLLYAQYRMEEQAQEIDTARQEARTDQLTGTANRKAFDEKLHLHLGAWQRENIPFVLILADLDHFKRINDAHGHPAGDRALELVGNALKEYVREGDFVARLGGDEFGILLPHTDAEAGRKVAERVREKVSEMTSDVTLANEQVAVGVSLGLAAVRRGDNSESIYSRADGALYRSKRQGRNQVSVEEQAVSVASIS